MKTLSLGVLLLLLCCGCGRPRKPPAEPGPIFERVYEEVAITPNATPAVVSDEKRLTISCEGMTLSKLLQYLANETGASLVADEQLDSRPLTFEVNNITLPELLGLVARRLGVQVGRVGNTWYLGQLRGEDRGVLVRRVRRLSADGVRAAVEVMLSDAGRLSTFADGLLICGDRVEVLERVRELLDRVEASGAESWVIQLYLVSVSDGAASELGIDSKPLIDLSLALATRSSGLSAGGNDAALLANALRSVLKAAASNQSVRIVAQPLFLVLDGETSKFSSGISIPVPKKAVSDQGTVTTQGFEYVHSGIECEVSIREVSTELVRFKVMVELGQVQGFVEQSPIRAKDHFETSAVLTAGGVYLLGSLNRSEQTNRSEGLTPKLQTLKTADQKTSHVQVWAKLHRVSGAALKSK